MSEFEKSGPAIRKIGALVEREFVAIAAVMAYLEVERNRLPVAKFRSHRAEVLSNRLAAVYRSLARPIRTAIAIGSSCLRTTKQATDETRQSLEKSARLMRLSNQRMHCRQIPRVNGIACWPKWKTRTDLVRAANAIPHILAL